VFYSSHFNLGTCESFFSFESNLESNRPSDLFSNRIFESNQPYTTQAVTPPNGPHAIGILYLWRTRVMYGLRNSELSTCLFQFSQKTRQTMLLYAYFTPKVYFKRKFNHHQSFLYEWRLTAWTIRKFRIGASYESNLESDVRFKIESNHEASQVPTRKVKRMTPICLERNISKQLKMLL